MVQNLTSDIVKSGGCAWMFSSEARYDEAPLMILLRDSERVATFLEARPSTTSGDILVNNVAGSVREPVNVAKILETIRRIQLLYRFEGGLYFVIQGVTLCWLQRLVGGYAGH